MQSSILESKKYIIYILYILKRIFRIKKDKENLFDILGKKLSSFNLSKKRNIHENEMMVQTDFEGWLYIRFEDTKSWKRRYCILKDGQLYVFKDFSQQQLLAIFPISENYTISPDEGSKTKFGFKATHKDSRTIHFSCESQLNMVSWVNAMVKAGQPSNLLSFISNIVNIDSLRKPMALIPLKNSNRESMAVHSSFLF